MISFWVRFAAMAVLSLGIPNSGLCRAPEPSLWHFVHPNAKAVIGIRWSRVQESELGRWIQRRWVAGAAMPGSEFLKDVEEILVSSPGVPLNGDQEEPPLLIAIRGTFDPHRVEELLLSHGVKKQMFGQIPLWRPTASSTGDPVFAMVDSRTILAGDLQSIFAALERPWSDSSSPEWLERAKSLSTRYDCWALLRDSGTIHGFLLSNLIGTTLSPDSQGFEAGISVREGLAMDVTLKVRTERAARSLQGKLNRNIQLASFQQTDSGGFRALLDKLRIATDGANVLLSLRLSAAEAARSLNPVREAHPPPPVPSEPPPNLTIKIEGLDDGPREVPFRP